MKRSAPSTFQEASSIAPTDAFRDAVREARISLADFGRVEGEELLILTTKLVLGGETVDARVWLDYPETADTRDMRDRMRQLNSFLATADIDFLDDGQEPAMDPQNRVMRRRFVVPPGEDTRVLTLSGRLYGGFWQNLKKHRRGGIRVQGEPVVVLDFSSMFVRLAYAHLGLLSPEGDLYALPGLEDHRDAVKVLVSALLFDQYTRTTWPQDAEEELPAGWTVPEMRRAILERHPQLCPAFGTGLGLHLMNTESRVLMDTLDDLRCRNIVGLGLHDGLLVPASRAGEVKTVLEKHALAVTSLQLPVTIKPTSGHLT